MTDVQTRPDTEITGTDEKAAGTSTATSRRVVLVGAGALGAGCLLAACGTDTSTSSGTTGSNGGDFSNNPAPAGSATADPATGGDSSGGGETLAAVADVPEGGGIIKGDYVITQPTAGEFKAFSKICTHQGCPVNKVDGGQIACPCHGSFFSIKDGSPTAGPAKKALPETKVKVDGDNIVAA
ncbi:Rieske (2Fe-2S) protein [Winogradskya consettensis]|uniref:Cytochrome bc1 complex Rieske iron-sulfur subunit n=1 Tax=Winogradskya consettensis TaxID=113560 RepID=A0A919T0C7_9ACTN|nr:Rieske (2Fe-2S) protein [Actinoplanes consettensis]GIM81036.1 iron-sulfur protein [Actinoplanes consettensis]